MESQVCKLCGNEMRIFRFEEGRDHRTVFYVCDQCTVSNSVRISIHTVTEEEKAELWKQVALAFTRSSNSHSVSGAIYWADEIVEAYTQRFDKGIVD